MRILIIEDEASIVRFLTLELEHEGYETASAPDGRTGLSMALSGDYDLILLDVMLPELSGMEVLRRFRKEKETGVIMLTARDSVSDKVAGLDAGANDYITKPFHIEELLARIRALTRKNPPADSGSALFAGDLQLDRSSRTAMRAGKSITLTKTEYDLLECLVRNKNLVLTREQILNAVWGYEYVGDSNIVDVYIRYVRAKINDTPENRLIETVRGVGYVVRCQN